MVDALLAAFVELVSGGHLLYLMGGVLLGLVIGLLPGLGGTAGMALLLPFVFGMEPGSALAMMMGLLAVLSMADTFPSVLMGIPGSSGSQATVMDGFPLARQGQGHRALSAAFTASLIGGVLGAAALTGLIQIAQPLIMAFGAPELLMLTVFGLSMVGALSGGNWARGIAASGVGLIIGNIGPAPATGHMRLTFGSSYLSDGLPLVVLALGVFALPEIIDLLNRRGRIATTTGLGSGWWQGVRDTLRNWWLLIRSSLLGCLIGIIPGLGGAVIDWITYGHAVQTSKDKSHFGKGDVRGVIAPEAANNAKDGGALVPTLIFGIPGSGGTAVLLGGLIMIGIQPGPRMILNYTDIVYLMIWSLALANVIGAILCSALAWPISRLAEVRFSIVGPFLVAIVMFGAFQATRNWGDLIAVTALGVAALTFKRFGWPRPPLLIGFVLSQGSEVYLYQTIQLYGATWLARPIVLVLMVVIVISVFLGVRASVDTEAAGSDDTPRQGVPFPLQVAFTALIATIGVYAIVDAWSLPTVSRLFPLWVGVAVVVFAMLSLVLTWRNAAAHIQLLRDWRLPTGDLRYIAWICALLAVIALMGFLPGLFIFMTAFFLLEARLSVMHSLALSIAAQAGLYLLSEALVIRFPAGILW